MHLVISFIVGIVVCIILLPIFEDSDATPLALVIGGLVGAFWLEILPYFLGLLGISFLCTGIWAVLPEQRHAFKVWRLKRKMELEKIHSRRQKELELLQAKLEEVQTEPYRSLLQEEIQEYENLTPKKNRRRQA